MLKVTEKLIKQLSRANLPLEDRTALLNAITGKLNVIPIGDIVVTTQNGIMINGKELDQDQTISFREACTLLKDNYARKVIHEQVRYKAIETGFLNATSLDTIMFGKAATWVMNEYEILLAKLTF